MRVVLEMIPNSANMFGIDTPKDLPSYRETMSPSMFATSRGMADYAWIRTRRHASHLRLLSSNGPVWSMRLGSCGDAIMFGPWTQWGWGFFGPYRTLYTREKREKKIWYLEFGYHKKWTIYTREKMEKKLVSRIWIVIKLRFFINLEIIGEEKLYIYF